jgi:hypothetical protein
MISLFRSLGLTCPCLPALLIVCLAPAAAPAESLRFRNETAGSLIIQTSYILQNTVRTGPRITLPARGTTGDETPPIVLPGNKIITIFDPRNPTRPVYQGTIPAGTEDLSFNIVPDVPVPRVKLEPRRPK